MSQVVVVGSINVDLSLDVDRHPAPGETLPGSGATLSPGGKGANQAVAAAKLGASVAMVGAVGDDPNSRVAMEGLKASSMDLSHVTTAPGATGLAVVVVDTHGENSIIVVPGANATVGADRVQAAQDAISGADIVVLQGEIPVAGIVRAAGLARGRLVFNHAPVIQVPRDVLLAADPLVVNEHEGALALTMLTGSHPASDEDVVEALVAAGVKSVVMTLGSRGSLVRTADAPLVSVPSATVEVVDSTGAGDAFVGALVKELARGADLVSAARFASRVGAFACTRPGAQNSYPSADDALPELQETPGT